MVIEEDLHCSSRVRGLQTQWEAVVPHPPAGHSGQKGQVWSAGGHSCTA